MAVLDRSFFERDPPTVARALLGHLVVRPDPERASAPRRVRIVETEAYLGPEDPGSHATRGPETQAGALWGEPGAAYVYVCYGIHQMLNVVAHAPGRVGAVLLRAGEPIDGLEAMHAARGDVDRERLAAGPGNLAEALGVTRARHERTDLTTADGLHLAEGTPAPAEDVAVTGRIGLSEGGDRLLRFVDATSPCLSRDPPSPDAPRIHNG